MRGEDGDVREGANASAVSRSKSPPVSIGAKCKCARARGGMPQEARRGAAGGGRRRGRRRRRRRGGPAGTLRAWSFVALASPPPPLASSLLYRPLPLRRFAGLEGRRAASTKGTAEGRGGGAEGEMEEEEGKA